MEYQVKYIPNFVKRLHTSTYKLFKMISSSL